MPNLDADLFVIGLLDEIDAGKVRLPSFPDAVVRVQRVLDDPKAGPVKIARVVGADAAFAARILRLSNSASLNPSGVPIQDVRVAVTRMGHQMVRCAAVSFALQQMNLGRNEPALTTSLRPLWQDGTLVAAIASVLARATRAANADEALLTGLMHNIGDLYLAVRTAGGGGNETTRDPEWPQVVRLWRPRIGHAILKQWKFPPNIVAAVGRQNAETNLQAARDSGETADLAAAAAPSDGLTDVLAAAVALIPCVFARERLGEQVAAVPAFARLGLDPPACDRLFAASAEEIRFLSAALSG